MIGGAKGIGLGIDLGLVNQYNRIGSQSYIEPEVLDSLVGVWSAYGMTNDSPNRSTIKNKLSNKGGDFVISNAAFKLNSGFGEYAADFLDWTSPKDAQKTSFEVKITSSNYKENWVAYKAPNTTFKAMKVRISGIPDGGALQFFRTTADGGGIKMVNGINEIPAFTNTVAAGFYIDIPLGFDWSNLVIEQIPSFEGAFVTDGVDDLITSTKTVQEMLGGSNEITVVSLITHISGTGKYNIIGDGGIQVSDYSGQTFMAGTSSSGEKIVELGDKEKLQAVQYTTFDSKLTIGLEDSSYAYYGTFVFNKENVPVDWIHQVIAYFNLDRTLNPDILCNVKKQGITNENHAEFGDKLIDFSGNGRDIQLNNIAWNKESGIDDNGALCLDGVDDYGKVTGMPVYKDYTVVTDREIFANIGAISSKNNPGAFVETVGKCVYSFGQATSDLNFISTRSISYLSKYSYCGQSITAGAAEDGTDMWLGTIRDNDSRFFNGVIYSLMSFPYSMSEFLIERQLKKHKLGTLYPDMVEWRPKVNINVPVVTPPTFSINNGSDIITNGQYISEGTEVTIRIFTTTDSSVVGINEATAKINGVNIELSPTGNKSYYVGRFIVSSKQKIDITIDEYIRYEDIVQPYPEMWVITQNAKKVSWGDKLKVGSEFGYNSKVNLLSGLYSSANSYYNGKVVKIGSVLKVEKQMVFACDYSWIGGTNEPKCILSPSRLRIPNSSYKILGYIPDISGHGNHGKINNSAYAGMSGANGYVENFTTWGVYKGAILTDNTIKTNSNFNPANSWVAYKSAKTILNSFSVNITGIPEGGILNFRVNADTFIELSNGRNDLSFDNILITVSSGFRITKGANLDWSNLVIQQIGQYEGAYCLDGVDDFITIPTTVGGKQVLMKVNSLNSDVNVIYDQRLPTNMKGTFAIMCDNNLAYSSWNTGQTYIDGILNKNIIGNQLVNITHNLTITNDGVTNNNSKSPFIGKSTDTEKHANMSLYDFMLFDNVSTDDKIKELNEYVGVEAKVQLPPYYWDAYGKTNSDADRDTIQQRGIAVGDYDLTNTNFAYDKMSGFGGYEFTKFDNTSEWIYTNNSDTIEVVNRDGYDVVLRKVGNGTNYWHFRNTIIKSLGQDIQIGVYANKSVQIVWQLKYKLEGETDYNTLAIASPTIEGNINTYVTLPYKTEQEIADLNAVDTYYSIYFIPIDLDINEEVTIEMLPLYPNGLVYDGITDYSKNANIPALTDFTVIAKRVWMNKDNPMNECFIHKGVVSTPIRESAFMLEYEIANDTYYRSSSYGGYINIERSNRPERIVYQTSNSYNGTSITKGSGADTTGIVIGGVTNNYWNGVFYKLILYPKTIPLLQINFLKNLMEKDEIIDLTNPIFIQE